MNKRTLGELAKQLEHEVKNRRSAPDSYDEYLTSLYEEAATRLRALDGERIETTGWAMVSAYTNEREWYFRAGDERPSHLWKPARLLVADTPQEGESR